MVPNIHISITYDGVLNHSKVVTKDDMIHV